MQADEKKAFLGNHRQTEREEGGRERGGLFFKSSSPPQPQIVCRIKLLSLSLLLLKAELRQGFPLLAYLFLQSHCRLVVYLWKDTAFTDSSGLTHTQSHLLEVNACCVCVYMYSEYKVTDAAA